MKCHGTNPRRQSVIIKVRRTGPISINTRSKVPIHIYVNKTDVKHKKLFLGVTSCLNTFKAISRHAWRLCGRPKIKLHTAPRPWVTRSPSRPSAPEWFLVHISSSSASTESGIQGTSPRSRLKDLLDAGKSTSKDFACNWRSWIRIFMAT